MTAKSAMELTIHFLLSVDQALDWVERTIWLV